MSAGQTGPSASTPLPPRLTADVSDSLALRTNPAGLGSLPYSELRLLYAYESGGASPAGDIDVNSGGLYGAWKLFDVLTLAGGYDFSVRRDASDGERGLIGVGLGMKTTSLGFAWELDDRYGSGPEGRVRLGFQSRPIRWVGIGAAVQDVGEAVGPRGWDLGLAIRPGVDWITASTQWRLTEGVAINGDTLDLEFLVNAEPIPGLVLGFGFDHDFDRLAFQLALDFGYAGTEGAFLLRDDQPLAAAQVVARSKPVPSLGQPRRMIVVDLEGDLQPDPEIDLLRGRIEFRAYGEAPLLLEAIAGSRSASGAFLRIGGLDVGWAKLEELRAGVRKIREAGKPVVCSVPAPDDRAYYLATACSLIITTPTSVFAVDGVAANLIFLGDALSNWGIDVEAVRREAYKSAPDTFTRGGPSSEQEEVVGELLDETYETLVDGIAEGRNVERDTVTAMIDSGTFTASTAVSRGWVDATIYPDEVEDWIRRRVGVTGFGGPGTLIKAERAPYGSPPRIALINIDATITGGESRRVPLGFGSTSGATTIVRALRRAKEDPQVRSIVLRVDSPGGDALASDLIAREVKRTNEVKPVVASFGDVAASGGYYVAAPSETIFAEKTSVTGSIGIFSIRVSIQRLLARFGINTVEYERGRHANLRSILQPLEADDRAVVDRQIDFLYRRFLETVAEGRSLDLDTVRALAQGRVWTGAAAQKRGLVDEIGGLLDAIQRARELGGFRPRERVDLLVLPETRRSLPEYVKVALNPDVEEKQQEWPAMFPPPMRSAIATLLTLHEGQLVALPPELLFID